MVGWVVEPTGSFACGADDLLAECHVAWWRPDVRAERCQLVRLRRDEVGAGVSGGATETGWLSAGQGKRSSAMVSHAPSHGLRARASLRVRDRDLPRLVIHGDADGAVADEVEPPVSTDKRSPEGCFPPLWQSISRRAQERRDIPLRSEGLAISVERDTEKADVLRFQIP